MTWTAGPGYDRGPVGPGYDHGPAFGAAPPLIPPVVTRKHGRRGALFTVVVIGALLLGALIMGIVVLLSGRPEAIAVGFVLAVVPVGPLVAAYLWLDRYEPEPVKLLLTAFGWGALVATGAAVVLQTVDQILNGSDEIWSAVVVAPVTEEIGKGLFVLLLLWARRHVIDGILDGLVYAGLVGIGFAFTENVLYFASAYAGGPDFGAGGLGSATALFILRGVLSPFAHPLFTSAIGIGVGVLVSARRPLPRVLAPLLGIVVAVALHAAWNASAMIDEGRFFLLTYVFAMVPGFFALVGLALWARYREGAILARSLTDLAQRGYLHPDEVPWLARLPSRRAARSNAALRGGPNAERLMRAYQAQAIELAALHHRYLKGTASAEFVARGREMAARLAALRAHLYLPQHADVQALPQHRREWG